MPRGKKSKKLRSLEEKLRIVKKELTRRKKAQNVSTSKNKRRKSMKSVFEECVALLEKVKKMQYSKAFLEPVDWKALNIPTYPQIIKQPMDLKTVDRKLNNASYHSPYDFARDMRLIYQNASTFNKPSTPYYISATKFAKKFEEEFERKIVDLHEDNEFTRKISKVITTLIRRDDSIAFRAPVNTKILEIPDYLDVIDIPMDLGTILNKIHHYTQFKHFVHDLFLVWDNCCRYNPKNNHIHQTAVKLREYTQKQLNRFCPSDFQMWQDPDAPTPNVYAASPLKMNISDANKENSQNNNNTSSHTEITPATQVNEAHEIEHTQAQHEVVMEEEDDDDDDEEQQPDIFKLCDDNENEEESNRMMITYLFAKTELDQTVIGNLDFQQKEELQRGIQCLDSDHFDPLINMLQSFIPEGEGEDDEVELDVDSIDDPLQVKMYNYMLRAIQQQENERIKREGGKTNNNNILAVKPMDIDCDIKMEDNTIESKLDDNEVSSPHVVNAFPINNTNNMQMNEDVNDNNNEDIDDIDIDMMNNGDNNVNNGDIVSDIANVIENMPVVDDNDNDVDVDVCVEIDEQGNDNDVTDTEIIEINGELEETHTHTHTHTHELEDDIKEDVEEVLEYINIPTMPVLQAVDDMENDDGKQAKVEEGNDNEIHVLESNNIEELVMDNDNMNDEIVTKIEENNVNVNMNDLLNINDANLNVNDVLQETEQNEDDDVDTPLADEIEF